MALSGEDLKMAKPLSFKLCILDFGTSHLLASAAICKNGGVTQRMRRVPYALAIGSIMYAVRCTRPDVAFAQNLCSHFQQNPSEIHWTVVKNILKYLKNTKDMVLVYRAKPEDELKVSCYADASFQTEKDDTESQTGYVFVLNGGAVDWKSAKQSTTAMSST
ncbi:hypothetical protein Tco_0760063 [Tanacetum coccineum]